MRGRRGRGGGWRVRGGDWTLRLVHNFCIFLLTFFERRSWIRILLSPHQSDVFGLKGWERCFLQCVALRLGLILNGQNFAIAFILCTACLVFGVHTLHINEHSDLVCYIKIYLFILSSSILMSPCLSSYLLKQNPGSLNTFELVRGSL